MTASSLFAVVDCAASPGLYEHAARLEPASAQCLFEGPIAPEVRAASPFLVELAPSDPLSRLWRREGWGRSWGVLLSSRATLPTVRRRLRHLTQVRLPDGSGPVLFRFWDPRVLRSFLPEVPRPELASWFTDIDRWIVETADGTGSLRFEIQDGGLQVRPGPPPGSKPQD